MSKQRHCHHNAILLRKSLLIILYELHWLNKAEVMILGFLHPDITQIKIILSCLVLEQIPLHVRSFYIM